MHYYVFQDNNPYVKERFIGVDMGGSYSSGGYPYNTDLTTAKIWTSRDEMLDYYKMFRKDHDWSIWHIVLFAT